MTKRLLLIGAAVLIFLLGGWITYRLTRSEPAPVESASVLLEKVREVVKLTTVEGEFTEIYSYNEYSGYFTWFWDKKALVRVQATVAVGYDLSNLNMAIDSSQRVLRIGPLPEPQILSIDHSLDYYDVSTGLFSEFSPQDYTRMNQKAKDLIREKAANSELISTARNQAGRIFDIVRFMGESAGWKVEILLPGDGAETPN
ncbi:MAG: DUF4230 domain-containing protein [Saprospiraceae bacterium]|nr:DUF4230 domain-containing protein [Saprospiraceae bacterium]